MGVCNRLDVLRQSIQSLPGVCKAMCVIVDVQVLTKNIFQYKSLKGILIENRGGEIQKERLNSHLLNIQKKIFLGQL